ncbi:hypothetical protein [Robertmurraya andreesenii]|uniref:Nuclease with TOPRIM domain n=1 Tax=Anoxybacillus andreesenii TaxID=1325932 RepID=A0ABT9V2L1_9BACL|nr:hypothetical protein [Robertmurraya andreesenii]MDQ0155181.1 putative nuclease with TOPRIM domain [Robertmurraya andreesenii]
MENNQLPKEELLEKLTEIYDQLEELEKTLDSNLSEHRKKRMNDHVSKLNSCDDRLSKIENAFESRRSQFDSIHKSKYHSRPNMKLELGF